MPMTTQSQLDVSTIILLIVGGFLLLPFLTMGFGFGGMTGGGGMMGGSGMMGGGYGTTGGLLTFLGPLLQFGFLAVLIGGAYLLLRNRQTGGSSDAALAELRQAYARGDISDEEFDRRMARLQQDE